MARGVESHVRSLKSMVSTTSVSPSPAPDGIPGYHVGFTSARMLPSVQVDNPERVDIATFIEDNDLRSRLHELLRVRWKGAANPLEGHLFAGSSVFFRPFMIFTVLAGIEILSPGFQRHLVRSAPAYLPSGFHTPVKSECVISSARRSLRRTRRCRRSKRGQSPTNKNRIRLILYAGDAVGRNKGQPGARDRVCGIFIHCSE